MKCRHCQSEFTVSLIDLITSPPSNAYLNKQELQATEKYFPLRVLVCTNCWLVQTEDYAGADELFLSDYAYFSSFSSSWLKLDCPQKFPHLSHYCKSIVLEQTKFLEK